MIQFTCNKIRERNNMNIIENIKSLFAKSETVKTGKTGKTVRILYAPLKTRRKLDSGVDLYTVKITSPLYKKGKKSGFTGRVEELDGQYRSFRFDRINSMVSA